MLPPPLDLSGFCSPNEIAEWISENTGIGEVSLDCFCNHALRQEVGCTFESDDRTALTKLSNLPNSTKSGNTVIFMIPAHSQFCCNGRKYGVPVFHNSCQCYVAYKKKSA